MIVPFIGGRSPIRVFIKVVLPLPEDPMRNIKSPVGISSPIQPRIFLIPYCISRFSIFMGRLYALFLLWQFLLIFRQY
jgi:hypothetical protein